MVRLRRRPEPRRWRTTQPRSSALQRVILRATDYSGLCRAAVMMDVGAVFIRTVVTAITPGGDIGDQASAGGWKARTP